MADVSTPAWELSKENVQPLKVGRKVKNLLTDRTTEQLGDEERCVSLFTAYFYAYLLLLVKSIMKLPKQKAEKIDFLFGIGMFYIRFALFVSLSHKLLSPDTSSGRDPTSLQTPLKPLKFLKSAPMI